MTSNDAHQERDVNQKNIDKVNALHAELSVLRDQINDSSQTASIERGEEFLLSEFQQVNDLWRHTDSRLESGLNIYLTATAIVIPGLVYIFQNINDFSAFLKIYSLIAIGLLVGGLVLDRRISGTARVKAEYIHALNRIRGYFKERYPQIAQRLVLPSEVDTDGLAIQRIKHHKAVFNL